MSKARTPIGHVGRIGEKKFIRRNQLTPTPASGAAGDKGDASDDRVLYELKCTESESFSLKYADLVKIYREAQMKSRIPAFCVSFVDSQGAPHSAGAWVALSERHFKELMERAYGDRSLFEE